MVWAITSCAWGNDAPRDCGQCERANATHHVVAIHSDTGARRGSPMCSDCLEAARIRADPPKVPAPLPEPVHA